MNWARCSRWRGTLEQSLPDFSPCHQNPAAPWPMEGEERGLRARSQGLQRASGSLLPEQPPPKRGCFQHSWSLGVPGTSLRQQWGCSGWSELPNPPAPGCPLFCAALPASPAASLSAPAPFCSPASSALRPSLHQRRCCICPATSCCHPIRRGLCSPGSCLRPDPVQAATAVRTLSWSAVPTPGRSRCDSRSICLIK